MKNHVLIYGAAGYTGHIISARAKAIGLPFTIGGRNQESLRRLSAELDVPYVAFSLEEAAQIDSCLEDTPVVLNCAGPYRRTAEPLMRAALRTRTHYLDIAAELDSYLLAAQLDAEAAAAGIMLLPGCGGSVAMLGCLSGMAAERLTKPRSISVALHVAGPMSRGSATSALEGIASRNFERKHGQLVNRESTETRMFDFGDGEFPCIPATLPDLITLARSTGASEIETFVHLGSGTFPSGDLRAMPDGPSEEERLANPYAAAVKVTDDDGVTVRGILHSVNGYTFTAMAAVEALKRAVDGERRGGFQTPATLFGNTFAETVGGTRIQIVPDPSQ